MISDEHLESETTSHSSNCSQPLTEENLRASQPLTEENLRAFDKRTMPPNTSQKANSASSSSKKGSVNSVRLLYERNHIYIDDEKAEKDGAEIITHATKIAKAFRKSRAFYKPEFGRKIKNAAKKGAQISELTMLVKVWVELIKQSRQKKVENAPGEVEDSNTGDAISWIETEWEKDHLSYGWQVHYQQGTVPQLLYFGDTLAMELARDVPKVENVAPDLVYSLDNDAFSTSKTQINKNLGANLTAGAVWHAFLIVEAKSFDAPIEEAENQCMRGGSANTRNKRKFSSLADGINFEDKDKTFMLSLKADQDKLLGPHSRHNTFRVPDKKNFTFTLALRPDKARLFVNWAEDEYFVEGGKLATVHWHMNRIASYNLDNDEEWIDLHNDLDNVLDWGVGQHKDEVNDLLSKIEDRGGVMKKRKITNQEA